MKTIFQTKTFWSAIVTAATAIIGVLADGETAGKITDVITVVFGLITTIFFREGVLAAERARTTTSSG